MTQCFYYFTMPNYSISERTCILEAYFETKSYIATKDAFVLQFPHSLIPDNSTITRLVRKFRETGSVVDIKVKHREATVLTDEKITEIYSDVMENPQISTRRLAQQVSVSHTTAYKAMRQQLGLHPYKVSVVHQLLPGDSETRLHFCEWLGDVVENDPHFMDTCFFTDEAWFHLSGYVNSQNCRFWSTENPHIIHELPLHSAKLGVWAAMNAERVFVCFFETTVNSEVYCGFVDKLIETLTEDELNRGWFQQDNATAHTSRRSLDHIEQFFGQRVISKGLWPPRSPDLSPPDFFLWGYLKSKVYENKPETLLALRQNIVQEVTRIPLQLLRSVSGSTIHRVQMCIQCNGSHFQHL
jgi:hypothetical protein